MQSYLQREAARRAFMERRALRQQGFIINPYAFGGPPTDPSFASVVLLMHCDGTNGSTTFVDSSSYGRTLTAQGAATLTTGLQQFGTASYSCPTAVAHAVTVPDAASMEPGGVDWTFEGWAARATGFGLTGIWVDKRGTGASGFAPIILGHSGTGEFRFLISVNGSSYSIDYTSATGVVPADDVFRYWKAYRTGNDFYVGYDGSQLYTTNLSGTCHDNSNDWVIGAASPDGVAHAGGAIDEVRYTVGVARTGFTVPTAAFPDS